MKITVEYIVHAPLPETDEDMNEIFADLESVAFEQNLELLGMVVDYGADV